MSLKGIILLNLRLIKIMNFKMIINKIKMCIKNYTSMEKRKIIKKTYKLINQVN